MAGLGEQIKKARKSKGMTQTELADKLFVTRSAVSNWEQDRRVPDLNMLRAISEALEDQSLLANEEALAQAQQEQTCDGQQGITEDIAPLRDIASASVKLPEEQLSETANHPFDMVGADSILLNTPVPADNAADANAESAPDIFQAAETSAAKEDTIAASRKGALQAGRKWPWLLACGLLCAALLIWVFILPSLRPKSIGNPYVDDSGQRYTIESMSKPAENMPGQAYLRVNPSVEISHGDQMDYFLHTFKMYEINGIALTIDRLDTIYFDKKKENAVISCTSKDISSQGMDPNVQPYGVFTWTGGLPKQNTVYGVGLLIYVTDENGVKEVFPSYISFPVS